MDLQGNSGSGDGHPLPLPGIIEIGCKGSKYEMHYALREVVSARLRIIGVARSFRQPRKVRCTSLEAGFPDIREVGLQQVDNARHICFDSSGIYVLCCVDNKKGQCVRRRLCR